MRIRKKQSSREGIVSLGQRILLALEEFVVNHMLILFIIALVAIIVGDFYARFIRINRDTNHINLMKRYIYLQMRRKYK